MLYKLDYKSQIPANITPSQAILEDDRELKRFKTSEESENDNELSLYSMMSPKLELIDRLHINGPIEDTLVYSNSNRFNLSNIAHNENSSKPPVKQAYKGLASHDPLSDSTVIFTSGKLNFLKTHLNSKSRISMKLENVDKIFNLKVRNDEAKDIDAIIMTSLNRWTKTFVIENDQFKEISSNLPLKQDGFTFHCDYKYGEYIIQAWKNQILLFPPDMKTELFKFEDFSSLGNEIKQISISQSKSQILLIGAENRLMILNINDIEIIIDHETVTNITSTSDIIKNDHPLIQFSTLMSKNDKQMYFLGSSNGILEIFDSSKRIFISKENVKFQPSLLTNSMYDIDNIRCLTDLTQPVENLSNIHVEGFE